MTMTDLPRLVMDMMGEGSVPTNAFPDKSNVSTQSGGEGGESSEMQIRQVHDVRG